MTISDGTISAIFAQAAALGRMINVHINFSWMKDEEYIRNTEKKSYIILKEIKNDGITL